MYTKTQCCFSTLQTYKPGQWKASCATVHMSSLSWEGRRESHHNSAPAEETARLGLFDSGPHTQLEETKTTRPPAPPCILSLRDIQPHTHRPTSDSEGLPLSVSCLFPVVPLRCTLLTPLRNADVGRPSQYTQEHMQYIHASIFSRLPTGTLLVPLLTHSLFVHVSSSLSSGAAAALSER